MPVISKPEVLFMVRVAPDLTVMLPYLTNDGLIDVSFVTTRSLFAAKAGAALKHNKKQRKHNDISVCEGWRGITQLFFAGVRVQDHLQF